MMVQAWAQAGMDCIGCVGCTYVTGVLAPAAYDWLVVRSLMAQAWLAQEVGSNQCSVEQPEQILRTAAEGLA